MSTIASSLPYATPRSSAKRAVEAEHHAVEAKDALNALQKKHAVLQTQLHGHNVAEVAVRVQQYDKADYLIDCSDACLRMRKYMEAQRMLQRAVHLLGEIPDCNDVKCSAWRSSLAKSGLTAKELQQHAEQKLKDVIATAAELSSMPRARPAQPKKSKDAPKQLAPRSEDDLSPMKAPGAAGWKKAVIGRAGTGKVVMYMGAHGAPVYQPEPFGGVPSPHPQSWDGQKQQQKTVLTQKQEQEQAEKEQASSPGSPWSVLPTMGTVGEPTPRTQSRTEVMSALKRAEEARVQAEVANAEKRVLEARVQELQDHLGGGIPSMGTVGIPTMGTAGVPSMGNAALPRPKATPRRTFNPRSPPAAASSVAPAKSLSSDDALPPLPVPGPNADRTCLRSCDSTSNCTVQ